MPTMPSIKPVLGRISSVGMLNSMINDPHNVHLHSLYDPDGDVVKNTVESIRAIGEQITQYAPMMNEVHNALVNRIGMEKLSRMIFNSPLNFAFRGKLEMGETVEEIFTGECDVHPFDLNESVHNYMKHYDMDVSSAFHTINFHEIYTVSVDYQRLKKAFLSLDGLDSYVDYIMASPAQTAENDLFMITKYIMAVMLLEGKITVEQIPAITKDTAADVVTAITATTNLFQFPSRKYTMAGNKNTTPIDRLYILESATANAYIKVNSLATAFNIDEVRFMGHVVMFDDLSEYDWPRMDKLFSKDKNYTRFTSDELALLKTVDFICMSEQFLQFYDVMRQMATPFINGDGLYTNYPYHVEMIGSASPFQNVLAFSTTGSTVTSVAVSPDAFNVVKGNSVALTATVTTTGFARSEVVWEITTAVTSDKTFMGQDGILRVGEDETATEITVRATSVFDETKYGEATATVTVPAARKTVVNVGK